VLRSRHNGCKRPAPLRDPTYLDDSWIGKDVGAKVPPMHGWIDSRYPGTKLTISEYNVGGLESLNGALTQTDVRLFRNYDSSGAQFGNTYVTSTSADQGRLSVYGAQRSSDGAVTAVVINNTGRVMTSSLAVKDFADRGTAQVWRYSAENLTKIVRHSDVPPRPRPA
jgi:hypothetical protein